MRHYCIQLGRESVNVQKKNIRRPYSQRQAGKELTSLMSTKKKLKDQII